VDNGGTRHPPRISKERVLVTLCLKSRAPQFYPDPGYPAGESNLASLSRRMERGPHAARRRQRRLAIITAYIEALGQQGSRTGVLIARRPAEAAGHRVASRWAGNRPSTGALSCHTRQASCRLCHGARIMSFVAQAVLGHGATLPSAGMEGLRTRACHGDEPHTGHTAPAFALDPALISCTRRPSRCATQSATRERARSNATVAPAATPCPRLLRRPQRGAARLSLMLDRRRRMG